MWGIPFFHLIIYADTFFVHPFFFAERSKQTQFHPFFFAERSKQTHFHPFFKADITVEPSKMGHIDHLWGLAVKEQMILSTKGRNMTLGTLEFQLKRLYPILSGSTKNWPQYSTLLFTIDCIFIVKEIRLF